VLSMSRATTIEARRLLNLGIGNEPGASQQHWRRTINLKGGKRGKEKETGRVDQPLGALGAVLGAAFCAGP